MVSLYCKFVWICLCHGGRENEAEGQFGTSGGEERGDAAGQAGLVGKWGTWYDMGLFSTHTYYIEK